MSGFRRVFHLPGSYFTVNTEESIFNMDETMTVNHQLSIFRRLLSAVVPMLLVAMSYIDPGKWAAAVEGGARYESNIVLLILVFNLAAILCQYLSARIAVVTDKDLAQVHTHYNYLLLVFIITSHFIIYLFKICPVTCYAFQRFAARSMARSHA